MKQIISVVLLVSIVFATVFYIPANAEPQSTGTTTSNTKMYTNAGTVGHAVPGETSSYVMDVPVNSTFQVLGSKLDGDGDKWYLVNYNGTTGYLYSGRVRLTATRYFDSDFEKNLLNFPAEYHEALRNLHNEYPNWRFVAEPTGCTFSQAVENEYRSGANNRPRKYVELTYMGEEWRDERAKNSDGSYDNAESDNRWTYASVMAISHFMNPINFLNSDAIFMFLQLADNDGNHTKEMLSTVVENTFLNSDIYLDAIMQAAAETKLSPLVIASLIIIEQGTAGTSPLISGAYPGYEGYYNFFNVGASGATGEEIVSSGLEYAKKQGWNSIVASITGGANFCKNGYISCGQDTYYYMDYNVVIGDYNHQYAAAIYDAYNKGIRLASTCKSNKNAVFYFVIPVFSPETTVDNPLEHNHNYSQLVIPPTCTEQGYTINTCDCGESYVDSYTSALGHSFSDWQIITPFSCITDGLERRVCSVCGEEEEQIIPAHHTEQLIRTVAPTCTTDGYDLVKCTACGTRYQTNMVEALGHVSHELIETIATTCTEQGYDIHSCERCGDTYYDNYTDTIGHDYKFNSTVPASCLKDGYYLYICSHCGDTKKTQIPALGHYFLDGFCVDCGVSEIIAPLDLNGDTEANAKDLVIIVDSLIYSEEYNKAYDLNNDGSVNILDLIALKKQIAKLV